MYVTKFTVLRGDRGLTEVTSDDILEALVHVQVTKQLLLGMLENYRGVYISFSSSYICYKKNYIYRHVSKLQCMNNEHS